MRTPLVTPFPATSSRLQGGGSPWSNQTSPRPVLYICRSFTLDRAEGLAPSGVEGFTLSAGDGPLFLSPLFPLHTKPSLVCLLFPLLTQKRGECTPPKNVGAPTFLIFPLIFRTFSLSLLTPGTVDRLPGHWHLSSFTCHSQFCYRGFTHPSPCLVTMLPSQGTNTYTMPTVNTRRTVHFYQCDPPSEIPS